MAKTESQIRLQKGDQAPSFALPGIDEKTHSLSELAGPEGTLVVFMANHCPYVKAKIAELVALHQEFGDQVAFVGVNSSDPDYPGEGLENMRAFTKERGMQFAYLIDENGDTARAYGATCTPDPFLFDREGRMVFHGRITDAMEPGDEASEHTMRNNLSRLVEGKAIDPWFNPSLGCSIKFKE